MVHYTGELRYAMTHRELYIELGIRIVFVFAILATVCYADRRFRCFVLTVEQIIASQAMITATFSLIQQIVNMKSLPA